MLFFAKRRRTPSRRNSSPAAYPQRVFLYWWSALPLAVWLAHMVHEAWFYRLGNRVLEAAGALLWCVAYSAQQVRCARQERQRRSVQPTWLQRFWHWVQRLYFPADYERIENETPTNELTYRSQVNRLQRIRNQNSRQS
ncbi:MAG: hypothetical protein K6T31_10075 [Alicyclobacillus sp.]|nr:hypothetical protein [Alicyclobacillus sp.]